MEMTITKDKVERILTDYYRTREDIKGTVKMKTKKEEVGYYTNEYTAAVTTIELSGTTILLGTEIPVKRIIPFDEYQGIFKSLLEEQGYEVNKLWIDNGINTEWTGWGPMESREEKTYCNGIKIEVKKQVKEYRR